MKKNYITSLRNLSLIMFVTLMFNQELLSQTVTQTFTFTGATQTFVIPPCVGGMTISLTGAKGAQGGTSGGTGANGGSVRAVLTATPGATLYVNVGGQGSVTTGGFNGGGDGGNSSATAGGGGGGASDIRLNGVALTDRIIVAAGGGGGGGSPTYVANGGTGGGGSSCSSPLGFGGGAATGFGTGNTAGGCAGGIAPNYASGGGGAGLTSGGAGGGAPSSATGGYGCLGVLGAGGAGGGTSFICGGATGGSNGGGGGGGGFYGGGGGMTGTGGGNGGGGGGSSWVNSTIFTTPTFTAGDGAGHGTVTITYDFMGTNAFVTATPSVICTGNTTNLNAGGVSTYTWLPVGNFAGSNSQSVALTPTATTAFTVTGTNSINCVSSAVVVVTVSPAAPALTLSASTTNTCQGTSVVLTASGALTYSWTGGVTNGTPFVPTSTSGYTVTGTNGCGSSTAATAVTISPLPLSLAVSPTVVCAGNVATITAVSVASTYTWLPLNTAGASNSLIVGPTANTIYTVIATNGTCSGTGTVALATLQVPTITMVTSTTSICIGESVTLTATGGLNYTWSPGSQTGGVIVVNPTSPTLFSVIGDNTAGCFGSASQGVVVNALPVINMASSSPEICSGSSVSLTATGTSHSYVWSSGGTAGTEVVTPANTSTYSVVGTDTITACQNTGTIDVSVYTPTLTVTGNTVICNGNITNLTATGANNYTWSSGSQFATETLSPNITSTYTVNGITYTNNLSCPGSKTFQILVNPNPTLTASSDRAEICKNESVTITAGGAQTYLWSNNETTPTITATSTLITTIFYTVTGTNAQGCATSTIVQVKVNSCTSLNENKTKFEGFSVYPNPSRGEVTLRADETLDVKVINAIGQVVDIVKLNPDNNYTTDVSGLSKGLYYFLAQAKSGTINHKVLVE